MDFLFLFSFFLLALTLQDSQVALVLLYQIKLIKTITNTADDIIGSQLILLSPFIT